jgi:hypothetical protein
MVVDMVAVVVMACPVGVVVMVGADMAVAVMVVGDMVVGVMVVEVVVEVMVVADIKSHPSQEYTCVLWGKELGPQCVLGNKTPQGITWAFPFLLGKNIPLDKTLGMPFLNRAHKHNLRHMRHHIQDSCSSLNYRSAHPYTDTISQDLLEGTNFLLHTVL